MVRWLGCRRATPCELSARGGLPEDLQGGGLVRWLGSVVVK
jgi:hypothetical protein